MSLIATRYSSTTYPNLSPRFTHSPHPPWTLSRPETIPKTPSAPCSTVLHPHLQQAQGLLSPSAPHMSTPASYTPHFTSCTYPEQRAQTTHRLHNTRTPKLQYPYLCILHGIYPHPDCIKLIYKHFPFMHFSRQASPTPHAAPSSQSRDPHSPMLI